MKRIPRYIICVCLALLSLKFTGYVGNGELPNFPLDGWQWAFFSCYPVFLSAVIGGLVLAVTIAVHRKIPCNLLLLVPFLPLLAGCIGLLRTTETDLSRLWMWHFAGAAAFAVAVCVCIHNDKDAVRWFVGTLGVVGLISVLKGWHQYFWGFDELRAYWEQMQANGIAVKDVMFEKLAQRRVYGQFIDPNVYSAHLLLCLPFSVYCAYSVGRRFEFPKVGAWLLTTAVSVLYLMAIYWSGSRGAMLGLAAGSACLVLSLPRVRVWRWRWTLPVAAVVLGVAVVLIYTARANRGGMASASARKDYYVNAVKMYRMHPVTGIGLCEFFPWYLRLKSADAEVTRNPHSLFFALLSECGIFGGLAALILVLLPWIASAHAKGRWASLACGALGGFMLHSMVQFNELIPGVIYVALAMVFMLFEDKAKSLPLKWNNVWRAALAVFGVACCMAMVRWRGEYVYQLAEEADKQRAGAGEALYFEAAKSLPNAPGPWRALTTSAMQRQDFPKALEYARELQRRTPHRSSSYSKLAQIYERLGRTEDAARARELAREWYPTHKEDE